MPTKTRFQIFYTSRIDVGSSKVVKASVGVLVVDWPRRGSLRVGWRLLGRALVWQSRQRALHFWIEVTRGVSFHDSAGPLVLKLGLLEGVEDPLLLRHERGLHLTSARGPRELSLSSRPRRR